MMSPSQHVLLGDSSYVVVLFWVWLRCSLLYLSTVRFIEFPFAMVIISWMTSLGCCMKLLLMKSFRFEPLHLDQPRSFSSEHMVL